MARPGGLPCDGVTEPGETGADVGVPVAVTLWVTLADGVTVPVALGDGVTVSVWVAVAVAVAVSVAVWVCVWVCVAVAVWVTVTGGAEAVPVTGAEAAVPGCLAAGADPGEGMVAACVKGGAAGLALGSGARAGGVCESHAEAETGRPGASEDLAGRPDEADAAASRPGGRRCCPAAVAGAGRRSFPDSAIDATAEVLVTVHTARTERTVILSQCEVSHIAASHRRTPLSGRIASGWLK